MPTAWVQGSPLTAEVYELIDYPAKVSFNYDVDIIVPFLDNLPTYLNILCSKCGQKYAFLDHLPTSSCPRSYWTTPKGFALELNSVNQLDRVADNVYKGLSIISDLFSLFKMSTNGFRPVGSYRDGWDCPIHLLPSKVHLF